MEGGKVKKGKKVRGRWNGGKRNKTSLVGFPLILSVLIAAVPPPQKSKHKSFWSVLFCWVLCILYHTKIDRY
jgi:hypothetical protein